jgi:HYR domain
MNTAGLKRRTRLLKVTLVAVATLLAVCLMALVETTKQAQAQTTPIGTLDANTLPKTNLGDTHAYMSLTTGHPATAQTFTATQSGKLTSAQLQIFKSCFYAGDLKMQISSTSGGAPTDNILAEATVAASDIPLADDAARGPGELVTVHFSSPAKVEAGKQYALIERLAAPELCSVFNDTAHYSNPVKEDEDYPGGHVYKYDSFQGDWHQVHTIFNDGTTTYVYDDLPFAIYVTPGDVTPPVLSLPDGITEVATGPNGAAVTFSTSATDDTDGPVPVSCSKNSGDTFPLGTTTVSCSATDAAGNTATGSFDVNVLFGWAGFFSPVDNPDVATNKAKAGSSIPVKFSLGGDQGLDIFATGTNPTTNEPFTYPTSTAMTCDSSAELDAIEETVTAGGSSLQYDSSLDQYTYVWKTNKAWAGTCRQLVVKLEDGTYHRANFQFVK